MIITIAKHRRVLRDLEQKLINSMDQSLEARDTFWTNEVNTLKDRHRLEVQALRGGNIELSNEIQRLRGVIMAEDHSDGKAARPIQVGQDNVDSGSSGGHVLEDTDLLLGPEDRLT